MKYVLNGIGTHLIRVKSKELVKFAWTAAPSLILMYLAIKYGMDDLVLMYIFMGIMYVLFWIYIPFNLRISLRKVILEIEFLDGQIKVLTKKGISFLKYFEIEKTQGAFKGFGKNHTDGYIFKNKDDFKEYWLIETFFNEIEEIENELKRYN